MRQRMVYKCQSLFTHIKYNHIYHEEIATSMECVSNPIVGKTSYQLSPLLIDRHIKVLSPIWLMTTLPIHSSLCDSIFQELWLG